MGKSEIEKLLYVIGSDKAESLSSIVVVSPVRSSELALNNLADIAVRRDERLWSGIERMRNAWAELASSILSSSDEPLFLENMNAQFEGIEDILKSIWILSFKSRESISYLDRMSSYFITEIFALKYKNENEGDEVTLSDAIGFLKDIKPSKGLTIIRGELPGLDSDGLSLEYESEYTSSLIASKLGARLTFWNNRGLLRNASYKEVPGASVIRHLSYEEATELSFFSAPIVHPHSFIPMEKSGLPIRLRYWGDVKDEGTLVEKKETRDEREVVKAFSSISGISLINVEGSGMSGVPGISSRLFSSLKEKGISIVLISQASSEYSICFAVRHADGSAAYEVTKKTFGKELESGAVSKVTLSGDLAILAVVGSQMPGAVGVAGKFFTSLAKAGVNIRAIAQGSSERNISAVIQERDAGKAIRALHSVFFLSSQTLSLGLFGPGNIGGTFLDQIEKERERLKKDFELDIRVRGIANSTRMLLSEDGIDLSTWRKDFKERSILYNEKIFLDHIGASYYPHKVIVDATTSEERAKSYKSLLEKGFHIITPNKKAGSGDYSYYKELMETTRKTGSRFFYETTVGAGLPVIVTLKDLRETGDEILKIEGMLSGTLSWLFSNYDGSMKFSALVLKAREMGFTEPDPRDDLSGMDVARKTVILAREMGYPVELGSFPVEPLFPSELASIPLSEFILRISELDSAIFELFNKAKASGKVLRYVGVAENGKCSVGLKEFPLDHPFAQAKGTDNVISFTTRRYNTQSLVIKGPGAGPEVTAGGVFADLLRLSEYLGSKV